MCGICGFTGPSDKGALERMAGSIFHRGPDEEGYYSSDLISLAIRRLSIIDPVTGHQPVHNEDQTVWSVFNGEIYNFKALRQELAAKGHQFYTHHSDSETIVHLYEEYGEDFPSRMNGMFAIALWDAKKRKLILVRDRNGVKPLFYAHAAGRLIYGSEIKAILASQFCEKRMDHSAIYHYFTFRNIPAPMTAFAGIKCLRPGEMLTYENGRIETRKWWRLIFRPDAGRDEPETAEAILDLLSDSTKIRMVSDVPIGAYLSGGVDSSAVVALMAGFSNAPVKTFTLGYEDELANKAADIHFARKVAQAYRTDHHEYIMSHQELVGDIEKVIEAFDQPFSGTISTYFLSKLISRHVKVALSGDGADELFGSYLSHRVAMPMSNYAQLRQRALAGGLSDAELALLAPCDIPFLEQLYDKAGNDETLWRYHLYATLDKDKESWLSDDFLQKVNGVSTLALLRSNFAGQTAADPLNRILEMEWNTQLPDQALAFVDFLSMAHSVEVRSPFLDYRLAELAATIPGEMKIKNGVVKDILKKALGSILPEGITKRPKEGFVLPIFDWMMEHMKEYSYSLVSQENLKKHGLFHKTNVQAMVERYHSGDRRLAAQVWTIMMFQVWWNKYFGEV